MRVSLLVHTTGRPSSVLPRASIAFAVNVVLFPASIVTSAGVTTTRAIGTSATVTTALPAAPSTTAVIVAVPGKRPVTCPVCETAATPALFVVHTTGRPVIATPRLSNAVATRFALPATKTLTLSGAMRTDAAREGSATTVTEAIPDFPSADAATSTRPAFTPETMPLSETVAIDGSALTHTTRRS